MVLIDQLKNCTAVILCGGKSSRMGFDKALLEVDGEFVLLKTIRQLKKLFATVLLVTNNRSKFPLSFSTIDIVEDHYPGKGPLGGLVTALESIRTERLFLFACDIPKCNLELICEMIKSIATNDIVVCKVDNRLETLFAFYHSSCLPIFRQQLQTNDWRIRKEFGRFSVKEVILERPISLGNVNLPEDLVLWRE